MVWNSPEYETPLLTERNEDRKVCLQAHLDIASVARHAEPPELGPYVETLLGAEQRLPGRGNDTCRKGEARLRHGPRIGHDHPPHVQRVVSVVACHLVEHSEDVARLLRAVVRLQALDDLDGIRRTPTSLSAPLVLMNAAAALSPARASGGTARIGNS